MADDPYAVLGVAREATDKQIRAAYLKLAKTSHPDLNPGDAAAEERFKAISAANDLLSDPERRARFDRGEIDAAGHERPPPGRQQYREHADGPDGARYSAAFNDDDLGDILSSLFRERGGPGRRRGGADYHFTMTISFLDAAHGGTQRLVLPDGGGLDVRIPANLNNGQTLRLRGKGEPGTPPGDALIEVSVAPHPVFRRHGRDISLDLPVSLAEAVLGGKVTVPTLDSPVTMTIKPGSESGTRLRLRGKGMPAAGRHPAGDEYAVLRIVLGPPDEALATFLRERTDAPVWDPRAGLEAAT